MYATVLNTLANALQCDIVANSDTAAPLAHCIARPPAAIVHCDLNAVNGFLSARKTSTETAIPAIPTIPNCRAQTMSSSSSAKLHLLPPDDPPLTDAGNEHLFTETLNLLGELAEASPDYTLAVLLSQQRRQMPIAISTVVQCWRHPPLLLWMIYGFPTCLSPPIARRLMVFVGRLLSPPHQHIIVQMLSRLAKLKLVVMMILQYLISHHHHPRKF